MIAANAVKSCADRAADQTASDIEEIPAPAFGRAVKFLRDLDQRAISRDNDTAERNASRVWDRAQDSRRDRADNRERDDAVKLAKPDMRDQRMRGGRLVNFPRGRRAKKTGHEQDRNDYPQEVA